MTLLLSHIQYRWAHIWIHIVIVGILICVVLIGAVLFRFLESGHEQLECDRVRKAKRESEQALIDGFATLVNGFTIASLNSICRFSWESDDANAEERAKHLINDYMYTILQSFENPYGDCAEEMWSFRKAVLFCSAALTTIGYGDVTPVTPLGRAALVIYALLGVPLALVALGDLAKFAANLFLRVTLKVVRLFDREHEIKDYEASTFLLWVIPISYPILMGVPIAYWEPTWNIMEAVYFSCVSILSIGYGDYVPSTTESTMVSMVIVLVGLILNSMLVDVVAGHFIEMVHYWGTFPETTKRFLKMVIKKATRSDKKG
ncbi:hypothetical protein QR680_000241 [Steinernema hermaphroditum]|uniref:Potassium channel domain-containing protein n=1 Tax=Steinernema hermaphroditum TaxID=289476 RepID=A0AA39GTX7_9BILA|nr:hypothetical protein QR680_000241 [Steinernema hermaphroditum]